MFPPQPSHTALTLELLRLTEVMRAYTRIAEDPLDERAVALISELSALAGRVEVTGRAMIAALGSRPH